MPGSRQGANQPTSPAGSRQAWPATVGSPFVHLAMDLASLHALANFDRNLYVYPRYICSYFLVIYIVGRYLPTYPQKRSAACRGSPRHPKQTRLEEKMKIESVRIGWLA